MADKAQSESPLVQAQLDRLDSMAAGKDMLGHERLAHLLARLEHPERALPPVFHVAGTNGKGSTIAYLRAALQAQGLTAHAFTSPHLVRLNERIRLANVLVSDAELAKLISDTLDVVGPEGTTFFEATTAAALLGFARHRADACLLEVGLGGRLDATNVVAQPAVCGIAHVAIDHQEFLGETLGEIAAEKAGIAKPGVPLCVVRQELEALAAIQRVAEQVGAPMLLQGRDWDAHFKGEHLLYHDEHGPLELPAPTLPGAHQATNAGLALAMLRHQTALTLDVDSLAAALTAAQWPARLQRLKAGPLTAQLPENATVWLDGAHNVAAMRVVTTYLAEQLATGEPLEVVFGLLANKDALGVLRELARLPCRLHCVPIASYDSRAPEELAAIACGMGLEASTNETLDAALAPISGDAPKVLIVGSLYLAGQVLRANEEFPD
ncbi:MAG: bifunctional folylpolyglutamate synthase/dihydrofolate synthase [Sphingomonadaceae bacterium]|nr:bifunctional folylpolyglutamate synthase/dihydrofolate synthase [Sphingomonadaceae bacterium]